MPKIILIGNTRTVVCAIEEIRKHDTESDIVLICPEGCLPYDAHKIPDFLAHDIEEKELFSKPKDFYQSNRVEVICDKKIEKIYTKRKRVVTDEKEQIPYDTLILEDKGAIRFSDVKGTNKKGVFHLKTLSDAKDFMLHLSLADVIAVEGDDLGLVKMAFALRAQNKEVILISHDQELLPKSLDAHTAQYLSHMLKDKQIQTTLDSGITDILGEGDVRAIRLKNGKVLESQAVVLGRAYRDLTYFDARDIPVKQGPCYFKMEDIILLEDIKHVEGFGEIDSFESILLLTQEKGRLIAAEILGQESQLNYPFRQVVLNFAGQDFFLVGRTCAQPGCVEYLKKDSQQNVYKKVFIKDQFVLGAVLVNCPQQQHAFCRYIQENIDIRQLPYHILEEQPQASECSKSSEQPETSLSCERNSEAFS